MTAERGEAPPGSGALAAIGIPGRQPEAKAISAVKVYRRHRCERRHRDSRTFLKCAVPRAAWIMGRGDLALIAWCGTPTITLHDSIESAEESKAAIDWGACGGRCTGRHEIVRVEVQS